MLPSRHLKQSKRAFEFERGKEYGLWLHTHSAGNNLNEFNPPSKQNKDKIKACTIIMA
jgi:hypothetical protein